MSSSLIFNGRDEKRVIITRPSSATSHPSSIDGKLARLRFQVIRTEAERVRFALFFLGAIPTAGNKTYAEMRAFGAANSLLYLGYIDGALRYLPADIPRQRILDAAAMLQDPVEDSGETRAALYELWLTTKHEKTSAVDRDAMLLVYASRLSQYPTETVKVVLGALSTTSMWFPAWSEIHTRINALTGNRVSLLTALRLFLNKHARNLE